MYHITPCVPTYLYMHIGTPCNVIRNTIVEGARVIATFSSGNSFTTFVCKLDQNRFKSCKYVMIVSYHGCYICTSYVLYEPATTYVYNEWYMYIIHTQ